MKKVLLFFVVAMAFASCTPKKAEGTVPNADSIAKVQADSIMNDSIAKATLKADSIARADSIAKTVKK